MSSTSFLQGLCRGDENLLLFCFVISLATRAFADGVGPSLQDGLASGVKLLKADRKAFVLSNFLYRQDCVLYRRLLLSQQDNLDYVVRSGPDVSWETDPESLTWLA